MSMCRKCTGASADSSGIVSWTTLIGVLGLVVLVLIVLSVAYVNTSIRRPTDEMAAEPTEFLLDQYAERRAESQIADEYWGIFDDIIEDAKHPEVELATTLLVINQILLVTLDDNVSEEDLALLDEVRQTLQENPAVDPMEIHALISD